VRAHDLPAAAGRRRFGAVRTRTTPAERRAGDYVVRVLGARPTLLRDFYHSLLRRPWSVTFAVITGVFLIVNALFAFGYMATGGIAGARPGSFADAFFFSVQTFGTIGYGALHPRPRPRTCWLRPSRSWG
jgi:hypothetical protein